MNNKHFTPEDDEIIRRLYQTHTAEQIGNLIGRTVSSVRNRCWRLGIFGKCRPWTEEEIRILKAAYSDITAPVNQEVLCRQLGRDKATVSRKASSMGLASRCRHRSELVVFKMGQRVKKQIAERGHPRGMAGKKHTEETKRRISEESQSRWDDPNNVFNTPEYRAKLKVIRRQSVHKRVCDAKSAYSRSKKGFREDINLWVRSSWEANYVRYLNSLIASGDVFHWEYEVKKFRFPDDGSRPTLYTPDFKVWFHDGRHEWHEVKGWFMPRAKDAVARFVECYPDEKLVIVGQKWFQMVEKRGGLAQTIPNWEWTQKRKWHSML